jgi:MFS transporter, PHS family, inorganic phosphate transporter
MLLWLTGTAGCWMLLDFCYYGNTISTPEILKLADSRASELHTVLLQLAIVGVFAVPGYIVAVLLLDRVGRRTIQLIGFTVTAVMFLLIGLIPAVVKNLAPFLILYGISYLFTEFGPNMTTFICPAELFPTEVRTTGHGISAGAGKLGAFIGAFVFPDFLASSLGIRGAMTIAGIVAIVGLALTFWTLPETRGKSLEQPQADAYAAEPGKLRVQTA